MPAIRICSLAFSSWLMLMLDFFFRREERRILKSSAEG